MWQGIFYSKVAVASAVVLLFYLFFALADSVHFKIDRDSKEGILQGEIVSLLDMAMAHRKYHTERTYSAPFATREYTKSVTVDAKGETLQAYLPLRHVNDKDFAQKSLMGTGAGIVLALLMIVPHWRRRKRRIQESVSYANIPWHIAYITLLLLLALFGWLYSMSFSYHVLGTDKVGADVLYASLKSIRTGVLIGTLTTLVTLPVAILLGVSAGYFRGWVDDLIQYLYTTLSSIPGVLLIAAGVLMMQVWVDQHPDWFASTVERSDLRLLFLVVILGVTSWTGLCRLVRAETLKIAKMDYVTAAKAFGVGSMRIMLRHIVPNLMHIILISVVLDFSSLVLAEAVLSYVGVGVDPTMYSWGNMINQARLEMAREPMVWWSLFASFVFMFVLVLAANLFSDRVQHVLDPRNVL
ncbi:Oligopeptide transport system permease protein [hydrothermal vent metagenome]|uniref:Oligopeptide transport system permease protein n=1 Tax=hydrothermal vent metagenome TaxID=652676 RepID=A0A1W1EAC7_9ZZZZ